MYLIGDKKAPICLLLIILPHIVFMQHNFKNVLKKLLFNVVYTFEEGLFIPKLIALVVQEFKSMMLFFFLLSIQFLLHFIIYKLLRCIGRSHHLAKFSSIVRFYELES
jgi:hypothetical protein